MRIDVSLPSMSLLFLIRNGKDLGKVSVQEKFTDFLMLMSNK